MTDSNIIQLNSPTVDSLSEVLKHGVQQLLAKVIELNTESVQLTWQQRISRPWYAMATYLSAQYKQG